MAQRPLLTILDLLPRHLVPRFHFSKSRLSTLFSLSFDCDNLLIRYAMRMTTSTQLRMTALLFLVDAISQLPKRWSFLSRDCWTLAGGVLLVRGLMVAVVNLGEETDPITKEEYSSLEAQPHTNCASSDVDQYMTVVNLAFNQCVSALLALVAVSSIGPAAAGTIYGTSNVVNASYVALITLIWTSLWFVVDEADSVSDPGCSDDIQSGVETGEGKRSTRKWLVLLAAAPLVLAVLKHGLSGNTLVSLSRQFDELVSNNRYSPPLWADRCFSCLVLQLTTSPDSITITDHSHSSFPSHQERLWNPRRIMNLPTVDVVVAYYDEPVSYVRTIISRISSELSWAHVNVVVYHQGIPGFAQNGTRDVTDITEQLRRDSGADLVVPRENTGRERDMGAYLQHM